VERNVERIAMRTFAASLFIALALAGTASAEWTPGHPGDPRICRYNTPDRPNYCGEIAAKLAFTTKYARVEGQPFAGQLRCLKTVTLTYMCAWSNSLGTHQTVVRFTHRRAGWTVAVGAIPA
jgi:hypothetical protein